ncbi:MAG TPA: MmcQ/YjbR family DNA-binding protein [Kofleriaceae bacterium]|jgi:predicted DNA-binding protein (MmcQ/YjbR family)
MARASRSRGPAAGFRAVETQLRSHALAKPEATEHFPWGERAIKVKGKVFLFMRAEAAELSLSTKLPQSASVALLLPFAQPTGYGLGKAGWVSARFDAGQAPPVDMLCAWIDESYQAVAPAKLAALARGGASSASTRSAREAPARPAGTASSRPPKAAAVRPPKAAPSRTRKAAAARKPEAAAARKPKAAAANRAARA